MITADMDTTVYPKNVNGFVATNHALVWKGARGEYPDVRRIYTVEDETVDWDLPDLRGSLQEGEKVYAMGTRYGFYAYVILKQSGRKITLSPIGRMGMRYRMTCNLQEPEDKTTFTVHVVKDYWR